MPSAPDDHLAAWVEHEPGGPVVRRVLVDEGAGQLRDGRGVGAVADRLGEAAFSNAVGVSFRTYGRLCPTVRCGWPAAQLRKGQITRERTRSKLVTGAACSLSTMMSSSAGPPVSSASAMADGSSSGSVTRFPCAPMARATFA